MPQNGTPSSIRIPLHTKSVLDLDIRLVIAGSYPLALTTDAAWEPADMDVYTPDSPLLLAALTSWGYKKSRQGGSGGLSSHYYYPPEASEVPVNVMQVDSSMTPMSVLEGFDLNIVQVGLVRDGDNVVAISTPAFQKSLEDKQMHLVQVTTPGKTFERIAKYVKRGYKAEMGLFVALMAEANKVKDVNVELSDEPLEYVPIASIPPMINKGIISDYFIPTLQTLAAANTTDST